MILNIFLFHIYGIQLPQIRTFDYTFSPSIPMNLLLYEIKRRVLKYVIYEAQKWKEGNKNDINGGKELL